MAVVMSILSLFGLLAGGGKPSGGNGGGETAPSKELQALLDKKIELCDLVECCWSRSGDENGNTDRLALARGDDGKIYLTVEFSPALWEPLRTDVYLAGDDALDQMREIIDRYNLPAWKDLPQGDEFVLDAATLHINMYFDNRPIGGGRFDSYSFDEYAVLPPEGREILKEYKNCLSQWIAEDRLVSSELSEQN